MAVKLLDSSSNTSFDIKPRTFALLEYFGNIMKQKGMKLKTLDEKVYHGIHLALIHLQIQQLKMELKDLEKAYILNTKQEETLEI